MGSLRARLGRQHGRVPRRRGLARIRHVTLDEVEILSNQPGEPPRVLFTAEHLALLLSYGEETSVDGLDVELHLAGQADLLQATTGGDQPPGRDPWDFIAENLRRAATLLGTRLTLEERLESGDESAWSLYLGTLEAALKLDQQLTPGAHGEMVSTKAMAERLGIKPKTLLRRKAKGHVTPAMQAI